MRIWPNGDDVHRCLFFRGRSGMAPRDRTHFRLFRAFSGRMHLSAGWRRPRPPKTMARLMLVCSPRPSTWILSVAGMKPPPMADKSNPTRSGCNLARVRQPLPGTRRPTGTSGTATTSSRSCSATSVRQGWIASRLARPSLGSVADLSPARRPRRTTTAEAVAAGRRVHARWQQPVGSSDYARR